MSIAICIHRYSLRAILHTAHKETGSVFYREYSGEPRNPSVALKKIKQRWNKVGKQTMQLVRYFAPAPNIQLS